MTGTKEPGKLKIALAQINFLVGNIAENINNIIKAASAARDGLGADIIVFPELIVTGYPAEDLLLRADFIEEANNAVHHLAESVNGIALVVGFPELADGKIYNSAVVLHQGVTLACYRKQGCPIMACLTNGAILLRAIKPVFSL
jgi:NAD+ synthase (glutamine-hydrolysing)